MKQIIAVNECGRRVGDSHHNSKLTDHEVEVIRELRGEGMTYKWLAEKFEVSKSFIAMICRFERRAQVPSRWKSVHVMEA